MLNAIFISQNSYFLTAGLTAVITLLIFVYLRIRFPKAAGKTLLLCIIFGFFWVLIAAFSEYLTVKTGIAPSYRGNLLKLVFYSVVMAGTVREFGKILIMRFLVFRHEGFRSPTDGIVFAVFIGFGFSIGYLIWSGITPYTTDPGQLRAYLTFPANLITAIIVGFFAGSAKTKSNPNVDLFTGLIAATLFHALYEFSLLTRDTTLQLMFFTGSLVIAAILIYKAFSFSNSKI